jgi:predicted ATPase
MVRPPSATPPRGPDQATPVLAAQVQDALLHLYDPGHLQTHPLAALVGGTERSSRGRALQRALVEAVDALKPPRDGAPGPKAVRRYRLLKLRYLDGLAPEAVRREVLIGRSEYYREQQRAIEAVTSLLAERLWAARPEATGSPSSAATVAEPSGRLPVYLTSFVGRRGDSAAVAELVAGARLVTLTGAGGCGKTRLASHVAAGLAGTYSDGVCFVDLAPLADEELVPRAVLSALGVHADASRQPLEQVVDHLRPKTALLLLDNCEHVVDAAARTAETLVHRCPGVRVLATSRERLGVAGEAPWRVPSLTVPRPGEHPSSEELVRFEAVQLFVDRARLVAPGFAPTGGNAAALAQVCARLDGIPLALELAAARVRVLTVEQIAARLDDRFRLLTGGSRTALRRQQTLQALIDWSHDLLAETERALLRRLSVFAGGFTLEAAEAVCAGTRHRPSAVDRLAVLDLLTGLIDKSLVVVEGQRAGEQRYRLPETLRQYAEEKLRQADEAVELRGRHRDQYLSLAEHAEPELYAPEQRRWLDQLEREHDNLRAALGWSLGAAEVELGLRLASALLDDPVTVGIPRLLARVPAVADDPASRATRARALAWAGWLGGFQAAGTVVSLCEDAVSLARTLPDGPVLAFALVNLAFWRVRQEQYVEARVLLAESIALARRFSDHATLAAAPSMAAGLALRAGDLAEARSMYEEYLAECRRAGDVTGTARALEGLGNTALTAGDAERAGELYREALSLYRAVGERTGIALAIRGLGIVAVERGDPSTAEPLLAECLATVGELAAWAGLPETLDALAGAAALRIGAEGRPAAERALRLAGAASATRAAMSMNAWRNPLAERWLAPAFATLGGRDAAAAETAWASGQAMAPEQATAYALASQGGVSPPSVSRSTAGENRDA